ncbi:substrate-binding periplasmic protein [Vibrio pectenicida]|uniref:Transporter substrate-binding domain-containing protein n=1 Tax=Vibrio pectenicida TaxID=62763 RepID=A0A427TXA1_9VIBR|nr:transporter substrate-binding domain-containing protein [Vibrio pectenicida]RSD29157.1 transporter substrate-binding domain-containing protein [Vibrio pectenicida]
MKVIIWIFFLLCNINVLLAKPISVTLFSTNDFPPYSYSINGEAKGIYPDIVRHVAKSMPNFDVTIKPVPWNRGLMLLESGNGFGFMPPYYLPDVRPYINPYSVPLFEETVAVYCHIDVARKLSDPIIWPETFYGLRVGINSGYNLGDQAFWQAQERGDIKVREAKDPEANILMMREKRNDCYLHISLSTNWTLRQMQNKTEIANSDWMVMVKEVSSQFGYIGYTSIADGFPFKKQFIDMFNSEFLKQRESGTLDNVIAPYLEE